MPSSVLTRELLTLQIVNGLGDPVGVETCRSGVPLQFLPFVRCMPPTVQEDRKTYSNASLQNDNSLLHPIYGPTGTNQLAGPGKDPGEVMFGLGLPCEHDATTPVRVNVGQFRVGNETYLLISSRISTR